MADEKRGDSGASRKSPRKKSGEHWTEENPVPVDAQGKVSVLVEMAAPPGATPSFAMSTVHSLDDPGFDVDNEFEVVPLNGNGGGSGMAASADGFVVRGVVDSAEQLEQIKAQPGVAGAWVDTPIAPIDLPDGHFYQAAEGEDGALASACPIPPCDCTPGTPKGTMASVATFIGVNQLWSQGLKGAGIVVGVVDGGITAQGRPVKQGETNRRIPRVIGGWPSDWGTEAAKWGEHGNMCATDVLGMAPDAQLYDFRISGRGGSPGTISRALQSFQWAINRHKQDGTPHILTNSWGIFQEAWDATYARNPNHPFTRKVVEAINEGIIVLFAAGNCGATCPDGRCGPDNGPGRDIWGANGHPLVMTVGAVNPLGQFIGYSSQGPAALDPDKPDFCGISHFTGYFRSDSGTSAATPIAAGVTALLKQGRKSATQSQIKAAFKATARNVGPPGFDRNSGAGIIQAKDALDRLGPSGAVDPCRRYQAYLNRVAQAARGDRSLRACLCYYLCRLGRRPGCTDRDRRILRRVAAILRRCPQLRAGFCRAIGCGTVDPCQRYVLYLRRVIRAAQGNRSLRSCLCYYLCRRGRRPRCTDSDRRIVRRVASILRRCPHFRSGFCRALGCPAGLGQSMAIPASGAFEADLDDFDDFDDDFDGDDSLLFDDGGFEADDGDDDLGDERDFESDEDDDDELGLGADDDLDFDDGEELDLDFDDGDGLLDEDLEDDDGFGLDDDDFDELDDELGLGPGADMDDFGMGPGADMDDLGMGPGADMDDLGMGPGADMDDLGMGPGADMDDLGLAPAPCPPPVVRLVRSVVGRARRDRRLRACLCAAFCGGGRLPPWCRRYARILRAVRAALRRCPGLRRRLCRALRCGCEDRRSFLRRVLQAARRNRALRACLCHFVCGQGPRPRPPICRRYANVIRRVRAILRHCPHLRRPFCRALGCGG